MLKNSIPGNRLNKLTKKSEQVELLKENTIILSYS